MSSNEARFRALVDELHAQVPPAEGAVRMLQGQDGVDVVATRQGALRLGIALLRAALEDRRETEEGEGDEEPSEALDELDSLIDSHSDTWIENVRIVDALPDPPAPHQPTLRDQAMTCGCTLAMVAGVAGLVFFISWVAGLIERGLG